MKLNVQVLKKKIAVGSFSDSLLFIINTWWEKYSTCLLTATRGRANITLMKASGGWWEPNWCELCEVPSNCSSGEECGQAVLLLETHFKIRPVSVCLKGTFLLLFAICFKFIYGNQIKIVSAYIYYNIGTDLIVLKCLPFMVVTSYYWIPNILKILKTNSVNVSVIESYYLLLKIP